MVVCQEERHSNLSHIYWVIYNIYKKYKKYKIYQLNKKSGIVPPDFKDSILDLDSR